jgi:hypothetical protein
MANRVFLFVFYSLLAIRHSPKKQGRRNAGRRHTQYIRTLRDAARALRGALRLPAFHRGSRGSEPTPPLSSSPRFLGRGFGGRYSAPACPSPAIQSQAGRNAGRAFSLKPPGSGGDEPLPAGTALAPPAGVTGRRPCGSETAPAFSGGANGVNPNHC